MNVLKDCMVKPHLWRLGQNIIIVSKYFMKKILATGIMYNSTGKNDR